MKVKLAKQHRRRAIASAFLRTQPPIENDTIDGTTLTPVHTTPSGNSTPSGARNNNSRSAGTSATPAGRVSSKRLRDDCCASCSSCLTLAKLYCCKSALDPTETPSEAQNLNGAFLMNNSENRAQMASSTRGTANMGTVQEGTCISGSSSSSPRSILKPSQNPSTTRSAYRTENVSREQPPLVDLDQATTLEADQTQPVATGARINLENLTPIAPIPAHIRESVVESATTTNNSIAGNGAHGSAPISYLPELTFTFNERLACSAPLNRGSAGTGINSIKVPAGNPSTAPISVISSSDSGNDLTESTLPHGQPSSETEGGPNSCLLPAIPDGTINSANTNTLPAGEQSFHDFWKS